MVRRKEGMQGALDELSTQLPRQLLQQLLIDKLDKLGVKIKHRTLKTIVDSILAAGGSGNLEIEVDDGALEGVALDFSDDEIAEFDRQTQIFLKDELPRIIVEVAEDSAASISRTLRRSWPERRAFELSQDAGFRARLELRWGKAFALLHILLTVSRELGDELHAKRRRAKRNVHRTEVLIRLHARACQVMAEILTLLEAGFADGAMARWRTMYEIGVVATIIADHGDELAERYLLHDVAEAKRGMDVYVRSYEALGYAAPSAEEIAEIDAAAASMEARFGAGFGSGYGWAAKLLNNKNPQFSQLEEAAGKAKMRSHYKLASHNVHAGVKGITHRLGAMGTETVILAGPSNGGLAEPGQNAAITLTQITFALLTDRRSLDDIVFMHVLAKLQDDAVKAFVRASEKLKHDHNRVVAAKARRRKK